jgi:RNA polymerase sigma factor (TIGR02999 family)
VTQALRAAGEGVEAADEALPLLYEELRRLAQGFLRRERRDHTLQATALVHEAYLRLVRQRSAGFQNRAEFFSAAAQIMRRVLTDHARGRNRQKRGGGAMRRTLDTAVAELEDRTGDLVALDEALKRLSAVDPRKARLVELRFFAGLTMEEAAGILGVSLRSAERDWTVARDWLRGQLGGSD